jgi:hypothetical protein
MTAPTKPAAPPAPHAPTAPVAHPVPVTKPVVVEDPKLVARARIQVLLDAIKNPNSTSYMNLRGAEEIEKLLLLL